MSLDITYVDSAIVLTAKSNNPTILNPDFLKFNKIINEDFELKQAPICTEPFSQIVYKNGLVVTSQLDKIIFLSNNIEQGFKLKDLVVIVKKYVNLISHVVYTGIGINPTSIIKFDNGTASDDYLIDKFLKIEKGNANILNPGLNFSIDTKADSRCNLKISSNKMLDKGKQRDIIVVNANFHHKLKYNMKSKIKTIIATIELYKSDIAFFENNVIKKYFKGDA